MQILLHCLKCGRKNFAGYWQRISKTDVESLIKSKEFKWKEIFCVECVEELRKEAK